MPVRLNHNFLRFRRLLLLIVMWLVFSADLFALPLKTDILNAEKKVVGLALVYIDYVELQEIDGTPLGRLGFVNIKGGFQMFVVRDDGQQNLVGSAKNRRLYDKEGKLIGHYDWTTFWSYVYAPDGTKTRDSGGTNTPECNALCFAEFSSIRSINVGPESCPVVMTD